MPERNAKSPEEKAQTAQEVGRWNTAGCGAADAESQYIIGTMLIIGLFAPMTAAAYQTSVLPTGAARSLKLMFWPELRPGLGAMIDMKKAFLIGAAALILAIASALFLVYGWQNLGELDPQYKASQSPENFVTYTIHTGDTLWTIAESYAPADMDPREYIYIIEQNNPGVLEPKSSLMPGDKILILMLPADEEVNTNA